MDLNKKVLISIFSLLIVGVVFVSASSYFSMNELHEKMVASEGFEEMHTAMMQGDFETSEKYHEKLDFECPMHDLVKEGDVSLDEFQVMHQWMMTGDFPKEKPVDFSDETWNLHKSHHPEIYR
ncbi:hypothetical protein HOD05_03920 [Candidatus Woesearchaeota archaeon]|jgi:hypothetical protein|nr:hypothetical protein [Candidatus Woesearchaeota archaeon]MBT4150700.1 hypothetical protein [Candidatus Woesearchaeota archaeon]MBT4434342.1 hypothetical protein [Candidatus Woesearchaeota archaeon]MBT5342654.1 hypothetical protein [Candidatus Woesearchaeota archaeon]